MPCCDAAAASGPGAVNTVPEAAATLAAADPGADRLAAALPAPAEGLHRTMAGLHGMRCRHAFVSQCGD